MIMTTSLVTCILDPAIDPAQLGVLLHALESSDETALEETDYFDQGWAADVPNAPERTGPFDDPNDPAKGSRRRGPTYHRVVAVQDGAYIGFLAGTLEPKGAFVAIAAALHPGSGVGPKLLDTFSKMAIDAGLPQLSLKPDRGDRHGDRVRFFKGQGFDWREGSTTHMCKPLVEAATEPLT